MPHSAGSPVIVVPQVHVVVIGAVALASHSSAATPDKRRLNSVQRRHGCTFIVLTGMTENEFIFLSLIFLINFWLKVKLFFILILRDKICTRPRTAAFNNLLYLYILCVFLYYLFFIPYLVLLSESCDISAGEISQEFLWFLELEL